MRLALPTRRPASRRGVSVLEFAVIAPVLVTLVFGMIEFSRLMMVEQILTNAAREGGRRAVIPGATEGEVTTAVNSYLTSSGVTGQTTAITPDPTTAATGSSVTVTVSVPFSQVSWLPHPLFLGTATVRASVVMRKESNNT